MRLLSSPSADLHSLPLTPVSCADDFRADPPFRLWDYGLTKVTGRSEPAWWTTLRDGAVSATTRPRRTTQRAAGPRRVASASSVQSQTTKLAGAPSPLRQAGISAARR